MKLMSMMPLSTAMPLSAMKPTAEEIVNRIPRTQSAKMPPVPASGTQRKMSAACRSEPKLRKISTKMSASASEPPRASITTTAIGLNIFPSMPRGSERAFRATSTKTACATSSARCRRAPSTRTAVEKTAAACASTTRRNAS